MPKIGYFQFCWLRLIWYNSFGYNGFVVLFSVFWPWLRNSSLEWVFAYFSQVKRENYCSEPSLEKASSKIFKKP